jgi:hypothetical protein
MAKVTKDNTTAVGVVPPNFYQKVSLRITDATFKMSSTGNPMMVFSLEVVDPLEVTLDGQKYNLDSAKLTKYQVIKSPNQDNRRTIGDFREKIGLPFEFDDENPDMDEYKGLVFDAMLGSKARIVQNRTGKDTYTPVLDANGQPQKLGCEWVFNIENTIGLSNMTVSDPTV